MQKLLGTFLLSMVVELLLVPLRGIYMPYVVRAMLTLLLIAAFTFFVLRSIAVRRNCLGHSLIN